MVELRLEIHRTAKHSSSNTASASNSSVTPTAVHAGNGASRNSAATRSMTGACARSPIWYERSATTADQFEPTSNWSAVVALRSYQIGLRAQAPVIDRKS